MTTTTADSTRPRPPKRRRVLETDQNQGDHNENDDLITPPASDGDFIDEESNNSSGKRNNGNKTKKSKSSSSSPTTTTTSPTATATDQVLCQATHVLQTAARALAHITTLYETSPSARASLTAAVQAVLAAQRSGGKVITCGVGKSAYIAQKLTATCKSLGVRASFMHAAEAAHGDLGDVREHDIILFVSFSGRTPELLNLLPHIPPSTRIIAMSAPLLPVDCALLAGRPDAILISTPILEKEEVSFGVCAPTTSTTVTLAVGDMLALTIAEQMHDEAGRSKADVFRRNHPGGAIGMSAKAIEDLEKTKKGEPLTVLELPSPSISGSDDR